VAEVIGGIWSVKGTAQDAKLTATTDILMALLACPQSFELALKERRVVRQQDHEPSDQAASLSKVTTRRR
jgi:hypothetical protein